MRSEWETTDDEGKFALDVDLAADRLEFKRPPKAQRGGKSGRERGRYTPPARSVLKQGGDH